MAKRLRRLEEEDEERRRGLNGGVLQLSSSSTVGPQGVSVMVAKGVIVGVGLVGVVVVFVGVEVVAVVARWVSVRVVDWTRGSLRGSVWRGGEGSVGWDWEEAGTGCVGAWG